MFAKLPSTFLTAALVVLMASGTALSQRGERGGGDRGGGDRGGSGRSGGQSSRSFSGDSGSSRSFSGNRESSRSSGNPGRSFSGREGSSRSFSGGSSRSSSERSRGSFDGNRERSGQGDSQFRSFRGSDSDNRSSIGRSTDSPRTGQFNDRSGRTGSIDGSRDRSSFNRERSDNISSRQYEARRPNDDQVRDFLQMDERRRDSDDRSLTRGDDDNQRDSRGRSDFRDRSRDFDRDDDDFRGLSRDDRDRRDDDSDRRRSFDQDRDRFSDNRDRDDDDFRGRGRDGRRDGDYDNWRRGIWLGERGEGRDNRDWSGRWRDGDRFNTARSIRGNWYNNWGFNSYPFYGNWWTNSGRGYGHWGFWGNYAQRYNRPYYWWTAARAPRLASWVSYGWPQYYYWDYGPGEYIYYDNGYVHVNGERYQEGPVFYDRTVQLVERAPDLSDDEAAEMEWLPLGVYAVTREGETEANVLVQLAVTKEGVIGGTAIVDDGRQTYPVEGIVEKETQRAVWSYTNARNERVLMETSVFNLTQPESTGLAQYGPEDMQVIELVRLEQPEEGVTTSSNPNSELPTPARQ
jgi:hypothetical protein